MTAFRSPVTRIQEQDDVDFSTVSGAHPVLTWNPTSGKFEGAAIDLSAYLTSASAAGTYATLGSLATTNSNLSTHTGNTSNPHNTTAAQVGALTQTQGDARYAAIGAVTGGGVLATGGFTLTVPAPGTVALLATSNLFSVRQDIRASGSGIAAALHVPWITGDTLPTMLVGSSSSNQIAIRAKSNGTYAVYAESAGNTGIFASGSNSGNAAVYAQGVGGAWGVLAEGGLKALISDATTNTAPTVVTIGHNSSGTPAAGFGGGVLIQLKSSTNTDQDASRSGTRWTTATHASRTAEAFVQVVTNAGSLADVAKFDGSATANDTGLWLWDANSTSLKRVVVGAADSGGVGYRLLRIAN